MRNLWLEEGLVTSTKEKGNPTVCSNTEDEKDEGDLVGVEATSTEEEFEAILGEELMMKKRRAEEVRSYANAWCGDDEAKILSEGPQIGFVNRNEGREEQGSWGTAEKEKMGSESQKVEECCRTPVKPRELKPIRESGEMCMIPKWRSKGDKEVVDDGREWLGYIGEEKRLVLKEHNLCFKVLSDGWAWWFCVTYMSTSGVMAGATEGLSTGSANKSVGMREPREIKYWNGCFGIEGLKWTKDGVDNSKLVEDSVKFRWAIKH
ncbi:hypothetical protein ACSQ67_001132 [Phaseolus vulgaris]